MAKQLSGFLEELKAKCDITEVIGAYVPLAQKGRNHWGRCPFHHEKTPSFAVNPDDQYYHCFGCGESGDVIKFVQSIESVDFMQAITILGDKCGLKVPQNLSFGDDKSSEEKKYRDRLYALMRDAAKHYHSRLLVSSGAAGAREYLKRRGITGQSIKRFGIGYSESYGALLEHLLSLGYTHEEMTAAGAVAVSDKGGYYDPMGTRLVIPVINSFGDVVAFGGRDLSGEAFAKYRNTSESRIFNKSKNLYAINLVKKHKQESGIDCIIVVEGYMDVIALHQAGCKNAVASMGTSLTKEQARLIKRFTPEAVICYDGDTAGQGATLRGLDILKSEGLNVRVIDLPDRLDPDDYIKKHGADSFLQLVRSALPLPDFKVRALKSKHDVTISDGRRKFVREAIAVAAEEADSAVREELLKQIRDITGITYESLKRELDTRVSGGAKAPDKLPAAAVQAEGSTVKAMRFILGSAVKGREYAADYERAQPFIDNDIHLKIYSYIQQCKEQCKPSRPSALFEVTAAEEHGEVAAVLESTEILDKSAEKQYYRDCMFLILSEGYENKLKLLTAQFEQETDIDRRREIALQIQVAASEKIGIKRG